MSDTPARRVGDRERTAVRDRLTDAYAQGALTTDELEERLATALSAVWTTDLGPLVADLPEPRDDAVGERWPTSSDRSPGPALPTPRPSPRSPRESGTTRRGRSAPLVVAGIAVAVVVGLPSWGADAVSVFGSSRLVAEAGEDVRVLTVFGSTEVVVPDDAGAETGILAVFGSSDCLEACTTTPSDATVTVSGFALFGSVEVVTRAEAANDAD